MAYVELGVKCRPNTIKENKAVLRELNIKKELDRSSEDLNKLFAELNTKNTWKFTADVNSSDYNWHNDKEIIKQLYGPIPGFPSGSWWGIRMDCSRDNVHDPFNESIQDGPLGAVSICTTHLNEDVDFGDFLTFTGRPYIYGNPKNESLIWNFQNKIPLRLIRGYSLSNEFAPKTGYRYDGLYMVIAYWIGVSLDSMRYHKFALARLRCQEPAPWQCNFTLLSQDSYSNVPKQSEPVTRYAFRKLPQTTCDVSSTTVSQLKNNADTLCRLSEKLKPSLKRKSNITLSNTGSILSSTKVMPDSHENARKSAIVTRRVSKKLSGSLEVAPEIKTSMVSNSELLLRSVSQNCSSKLIPSKLQNTNISIRTDLYDSSDNMQRDKKKAASTTFCRGFKLSGMCRRVLNYRDSESALIPGKNDSESKIETSQLSKELIVKSSTFSNQRSTSGEDAGQESLEIRSTKSLENRLTNPQTGHSRSSILSPTQSPINEVDPSAVKGHIFRYGDGIIDSSRPVLTNLNLIDNDTTNDELNSEHSEFVEHSYVVPSYRQMLRRHKADGILKNLTEVQSKIISKSSEKMINRSEADNSKNRPLVSPVTRKNVEVEGSSIENDDLRESQSFFNSLDSLTPDKVLNLIIKEKYHPLAKLLIGNMIGLTTGESTILKAYDELMSHSSTENENSREKNSITTTKNLQTISDQIVDRSTTENCIFQKHSNSAESSKCDSEQRTLRHMHQYTNPLNTSKRILRQKIHKDVTQSFSSIKKNSLKARTTRPKLQAKQGKEYQASTSARMVISTNKSVKNPKDQTRADNIGQSVKQNKKSNSNITRPVVNFKVIHDSDHLTEKTKVPQTRLSESAMIPKLRNNGLNRDSTLKSKNLSDIKIAARSTSKAATVTRSTMCRKRRSEIANLVIDANIGPKIRGPRTRRLRPMNLIRTKKRYGDDPVDKPTYPQKQSKISVEMKLVSRSDLSKRRRRLKNGATKSSVQLQSVNRNKVTGRQHKNVRRMKSKTLKSRNSRNLKITRLSSIKSHKRKTKQSNCIGTSNFMTTRRTVGCGCEEVERTKPRMVDATTQCLLSHKPITLSSKNRTTNTNQSDFHAPPVEQRTMKVDVINLVDVKSESVEDDVMILDEENHEISRCAGQKNDSERRSVLNQSYESFGKAGKNDVAHVKAKKDHACSEYQYDTVRSRSPTDIEFQSNSQSQADEEFESYIDQRPSAFVPVNTFDSNLRIARLKSIGFKPIRPCSYSRCNGRYGLYCGHQRTSDSPKGSSAVIRRVVNEEYDKYTSEENNVVGYMDEELHYEEIEDEDEHDSFSDEITIHKTEFTKIVEKSPFITDSTECLEFEEKCWHSEPNNEQLERKKKESYSISSLEDDSDVPWHGWRKVTTEEQTYWVGW